MAVFFSYVTFGAAGDESFDGRACVVGEQDGGLVAAEIGDEKLAQAHALLFVETCHWRRAQRRSRTALLQRRRRLVLDGREHGGRLPAIGWLAA
jgi:hypothetical protein